MSKYKLYLQKWYTLLCENKSSIENANEEVESELDDLWYSLSKSDMLSLNSLYKLLNSMDSIDPMLEFLSEYLIELHTSDSEIIIDYSQFTRENRNSILNNESVVGKNSITLNPRDYLDIFYHIESELDKNPITLNPMKRDHRTVIETRFAY